MCGCEGIARFANSHGRSTKVVSVRPPSFLSFLFLEPQFPFLGQRHGSVCCFLAAEAVTHLVQATVKDKL